MITLSGVRSSCDIVETNSVFSWLARFASSTRRTFVERHRRELRDAHRDALLAHREALVALAIRGGEKTDQRVAAPQSDVQRATDAVGGEQRRGVGIGDGVGPDLYGVARLERLEQACQQRRRHAEAIERCVRVGGIAVGGSGHPRVAVLGADDRVAAVACEELGGEPRDALEHRRRACRGQHDPSGANESLSDV